MAHPWQRVSRKYYEKSPSTGAEHPLSPEVTTESAKDLEDEEIPSSSLGDSTGWTDEDMRVGPEVHDIEFYPGGRILPGAAGRAPAQGCYLDVDTGEIVEYEADRYTDKDTAGEWEETRIETQETEYMPGQLLPRDLAEKLGTDRAPKGKPIFKRGVHYNR
ncbi:hypothetical protein GEMRC1_000012 [Eukaryota sp. GEM-RC1]